MQNVFRPTDEQLMLDLKAGDMAAFETLYDRYNKRLFRYILRFVTQRDVAEDILQETFLRILKHRKVYLEKSRFSTYLFTIARNLCFDNLKSWQVRHLNANQADTIERTGDAYQDSHKSLEDREMGKILQKAIDNLPADQKEILTLSKFSGLSYEEIAQIVGCTPAAAKQKAYRALLGLKRDLKSFKA